MNRSQRKALAEETLAIIEAGEYSSSDGKRVCLREEIRACIEGTRYFTPEERVQLLGKLPPGKHAEETAITVANETSLAGLTYLLEARAGRIGILNFASAKNPGGGFLSGSQAQEESLARSSALYASLRGVPDYYDYHRHSDDLLYSDRLIFSRVVRSFVGMTVTC